MTASIDARTFPRPEQFSPAEWSARVELAAAYRIFNHMGWTELIYNHISVRVPGPETQFLINPFGLHYSEVTASNLLKIDRHFVNGCHSDPHRRAVLISIADLAVRLGGEAVAEGIEDERDLEAVTNLGIDLVQGYLLCQPRTSSALREVEVLAEVSRR